MPDHLFDITGRLALVTGSSRGLGYAMALGLAGRGACVILHGRDDARVTAAAQEMSTATGADIAHVSFDVADAQATRTALAQLIDRHGVPDILVNNAGLQRRGAIHKIAPDDWDAVIATNLSSVFHVSRELVSGMIARGSGKIVNTGSAHSALARATSAPYSASKAGVAMLTRGMAADLARHGIQVNCLSPGFFQTDITAALWQDPDFDSWLRERTPSARWGQPDDLVGTLIYLCSDASNFVCGQNLFVDGGLTSVV
ncbi:SDR family oxidoreductase [Salinisphaera aquimarina]|uniref:SDR family oxidoreductase n=1 Tax=Salinisphaera aquimarina TaxID=2094031 RepID=A0ABV7ES55_9GAMM